MLLNKNKFDVLSILQIISIPIVFSILFCTVIFCRDDISLMLFYLVVLVFVVAGSVLCLAQYRFLHNNIENIVSVKDDLVFVRTLTKTYQFRLKDIRFGKVGLGVWVGDTSKKISFTRLNMGKKNFNILLTQLNSVK